MKPTTFLLTLALAILLLPASLTAQSWLDGQWEGVGLQANNGHKWTILFTADSESGTYKIEYPSLDCGGEWQVEVIEDNRVVFREVIKTGTFRCVTLGKVIVTQVDAQHLSFSWFEAYDDSLGAWSTLKRKAPL